MTKRSAMAMAGGLALSLVLGVLAITWMAGGVSIASAGAEQKPLVRHEVKTVTVHRKAHASGDGVVRVIELSGSSTSSMDRSGENEHEGVEHEGNDDGSEHQQGDDQQGQHGQQGDGSQGTSGDD